MLSLHHRQGDQLYTMAVQTSNARYKAAVGSQPHGAECMAALGFQPIMEASEEVGTLGAVQPLLTMLSHDTAAGTDCSTNAGFGSAHIEVAPSAAALSAAPDPH